MAKHYAATSLTGGGSGALDKINGSLLSDGDTARVTIKATGRTYFYHLDATSGAAESSPDVIAPDTSADSKRWILSKVEVDASTLGTSAPNDMATESEATTGAATDKVMSPATSRAAFDSWVGGKTSVPRQAILTGKVDSDGLPAFLAVSGNDVQIVATADDPLLLSFSAGFGSQGPVDYFGNLTSTFVAWANAGFALGVRNYLWSQRETDGSITYGVTDIQPEYSHKREGVVYPNTTTYIGDMTASGGLAAAFDGNVSQVNAACATKVSTLAASVGMDFITPTVLRGAEVYSSTDSGFSNGATSITVEMLGNSTNDTGTATVIATQVVTDANGISTKLWYASQVTAYRYYWIRFTQSSSATCFCAEVRWLATDDHFDLNTYSMQAPDGTQRHRLYLGHVDVSGAGVLSNLYCYAIGVYAVRAVNGGSNVAVNTTYSEMNPFCAPVEAVLEVYADAYWRRAGYTEWNASSDARYGSRVVRTDHTVIQCKTGANALLPSLMSGLSASVTQAPARIIVQRAF